MHKAYRFWERLLNSRYDFRHDTIQYKIVDMASDQLWNGLHAPVTYSASERPLSDVMDFVEIADTLRGEV